MASIIRLGDLEIRARERRLLRHGVDVPLGSRAFDLLLALIDHEDRVVSKDELMRSAWPRSVVEENNLTVQMSSLRKLLGPDAIRTVPGRGYQLALTATIAADSREPPLGLPGLPSVAVLPFVAAGEGDHAHLAQGMTEDITTELCRFHSLFVIGSGTAMRYTGPDVAPRALASELGVHFVLQGSVRLFRERVRVSVQLSEGETGRQVWAERYDDTLADLFDLQERITRQVVSSMVPELRAEEMRRVRSGQRRFGEAEDLAWRALQCIYESMHAGVHEPDAARQLAEARGFAERALQRDPSCRQALMVLSLSHTLDFFFGWTADRRASMNEARSAAQRHMHLAPEDSHSYYLRGLAEALGGDFSAGAQDMRRAHELNPNDSLVMFALAWIEAAEGNLAQARRLAQQAMRQSPKDPWLGLAHLALAMCAFVEDDLQAVQHWGGLALQSQPSAPLRRVLLLAGSLAGGDEQRARLHRESLQAVTPGFLPSLLSGELRPFHQPQHMEKLLAALRGENRPGASARRADGGPASP